MKTSIAACSSSVMEWQNQSRVFYILDLSLFQGRLSSDNLFQRTRRVIHPGHHAAHIDEVASCEALLGAGGFDFSAELLQEGVFPCVVNVTIEHITALAVGGPMEGHRVMAEDHPSAVVCDFFIIRNVLKISLCLLRKPLGIVIAGDQHFVPGKLFEPPRPLHFLSPDHISEDIDRIACAYGPVPVMNDRTVHFIQACEGAVIKADHIFMSKVEICDVIVCQCTPPQFACFGVR